MESYQRRKKLTKEIEENFPKLNFKPAEFQDFLVKIGFCEPVTITDMKDEFLSIASWVFMLVLHAPKL